MNRAGWMTFLCGLFLSLVVFPVLCPAAEDPQDHPGKTKIWVEVRPGLSLARFDADQKETLGMGTPGETPDLTVLRIDPHVYRFRLLSISELKIESLSLKEWAEKYGLDAVINAGMFWQDQRTSAGYLRNFSHLNQGRIHPDFGGFLVFHPRKRELPSVQIVDRFHCSSWRQLLNQYASVVQSYRLIGRNGTIVWHRKGERYRASCIAEDAQGRILFIHSQKQQTMKRLGRLLLDLPLDIDVCIFTEGGDHAGLRVATPSLERSWPWPSEHGFWSGGAEMKIPNVVGIEPRKRSFKWPEYGIIPYGF